MRKISISINNEWRLSFSFLSSFSFYSCFWIHDCIGYCDWLDVGCMWKHEVFLRRLLNAADFDRSARIYTAEVLTLRWAIHVQAMSDEAACREIPHLVPTHSSVTDQNSYVGVQVQVHDQHHSRSIPFHNTICSVLVLPMWQISSLHPSR